MIEKAFGKTPVENYGMAEGVANISQHEDGVLKVDEDYSATEFIPTEDSNIFKIIGTNFSNLATPLIRYNTNDLASLSKGTSHTDNKKGRFVESIDGRDEDYIMLNDGSKIGRLDHIFKDHINIKMAQLQQSLPGEIVVYIVPSRRYTSKDEDRLLTDFNKYLGDRVTITIIRKKTIERSGSGKIQFIVSKITN